MYFYVTNPVQKLNYSIQKEDNRLLTKLEKGFQKNQ